MSGDRTVLSSDRINLERINVLIVDDNLQALSSIPPELRTHDPFALATDRPATTGARTTITAAKSSDASRHGSNSQAGS